jgi:hypothetical protein
MMETEGISEVSVSFYHSAQCNIPEDVFILVAMRT